jgi:prepilin-type N-terminal cleavage/methylation domain-containing protein
MTTTREKGFTLVEVIVALVLLGIVSAIAGMGLVVLAHGYLFSKQNATMVDKGQTAITRIVKELGDCTVTAGTATSVTVRRQSDGTSHTFSWAGAAGAPLLLTDPGNDIAVLTDNVASFSLAYYDNGGSIVAATAASLSQVQSTLQLIAADNSVHTFTNRVYIKTQ